MHQGGRAVALGTEEQYVEQKKRTICTPNAISVTASSQRSAGGVGSEPSGENA